MLKFLFREWLRDICYQLVLINAEHWFNNIWMDTSRPISHTTGQLSVSSKDSVMTKFNSQLNK